MSDQPEKLAALEERTKAHHRRIDILESGSLEQKDVDPLKERVAGLEKNQRWGILTIISLMLKAVFDFFQGGGMTQ